jgi:Zn-dependent protease with chaperone function
MNKKFLLVSMVSLLVAGAQAGVYRVEYEALKQSPDYKLLVDGEAADSLRGICRDIENYQELTRFQRFVRGAFMSLDAFVVTPRTMPKLYAYIDTMCKSQKMVTPTIFVSTIQGFFGAAAQKLLKSSGAIIIGEKLVLEAFDEELEAVVAHEIGHIKHDHVNKILFLTTIAYVPALYMVHRFDKPLVFDFSSFKQTASLYRRLMIANLAANLLTSLYVNKRYEKEADEFACKTMGKSKGLIKFFEQSLHKERVQEEDLVKIGELLEQNSSKLTKFDYVTLNVRYYLAKAGHRLNDAFSWLYHHTFIGAHPAPEERILVAKGYLNS